MNRVPELLSAADAVRYLGAELRAGKFTPSRRSAPTGGAADDMGSIEAVRRSALSRPGIGYVERAGTIVLRKAVTRDLIVLPDGEWGSHPAVYDWPGSTQWNRRVVLFPWVADEQVLDAVEASGVTPQYVRAAWDSGLRDPDAVIEHWSLGIPEEYIVADSRRVVTIPACTL